MITLEDLQFITDRNEGLGIPLTILERFTSCNKSSLSKYIREENPLTENASWKIEQGLYDYIEQLADILGISFSDETTYFDE